MEAIPVLSIFAENKPGKLEKITEVLAREGINILGFSIVSVKDFGIIKFLVDKPELAFQKFKERGFTVAKVPCLGLELEDRPGGLYEMVKLISSKGINIESALVYVAETRKRAYFVFEADNLDSAWETLKEEKVNFLKPSDFINE
ncbi:acetolactate synthase [Caldimicrobium thiodismutans]|uniref:Acetolactate synthase n=1 Tax=Caldimicrobium thiodismutans TaxID=1653476 RepID=A0A0U5ARU0_9BACT|nr:ACT domain-containing protein [Caldimicrobium thiodismutans]BAU23633.1 acetolactate synthase [Caldimicrobium thiodismutans]